jgi:hypothetical protein
MDSSVVKQPQQGGRDRKFYSSRRRTIVRRIFDQPLMDSSIIVEQLQYVVYSYCEQKRGVGYI